MNRIDHIRQRRKELLRADDNLSNLADAMDEGDVKDAETYYDTREDMKEAWAGFYRSVLEQIADTKLNASDARKAARVALGRRTNG